MPVTLTYPGVYIEEISSGVRTITGVSTSITAFVGAARRGPINKAVRLSSYSDFERTFGGLSADSDLSYAVRQFFLNGGRDAYVVRLVKNSGKATRTLKDSNGQDVLKLTALDEGASGNYIEVRIDYQSATPSGTLANTFNLTLNYAPADAPQENRSETFQNLSMNSYDRRYVENIINGSSRLVKVERLAKLDTIKDMKGYSLSGNLTLSDLQRDDNHDQLQIAVNASTPVTIQIMDADLQGTDLTARLKTLCAAIQEEVRVANPDSFASFSCSPDTSNSRIRMESGQSGETSSVRVLPGTRSDLANRLQLGTANGGTEVDAIAAIRPAEVPEHGNLTSGVLADVSTVPSTTSNSFKLSLDSDTSCLINLGDIKASGSVLKAQLEDIATRIQTAVHTVKSAKLAYSHFSCTVKDDNKLVLTAGTRGKGSSVVVNAADQSDIAAILNLLGDAISLRPQNMMLQNGFEVAYTQEDAYNVFIANQPRKGIYALDEVDLFNILCLPGVTDAGILQDAAAYCDDRRALLLIDVPQEVREPAAIAALVSGPALPKSKNAAIYYPWLQIADPLKDGKLNNFAPSGTLAGLYARTDSTRGVWKAPAGTEATLVGVQGVTYILTDAENGTLNQLGVNCIRTFPVFGAVAWGARTLRGADQMADEWKYVSIRRTALFIEESLYRGTQWVVFEPNDEPLWAQIRLNIGAFMNNLFRQGAFQGKTPREAYFVKCDRETTTQNDINLGIVNIVVGFAPLKPAEFVVIKLQQMAGQIQV